MSDNQDRSQVKKPLNVVVSTPCYGGLMTHVYVTSLLKLMAVLPRLVDGGIRLGLSTAAHDSLVPRSRNALVKAFLDFPGATHLFFVDADIGFEPEAVQRMLAFDQDVVAGMYPVKVIDWDRVGTAAAQARTGTVAVAPEELRQAGLHFVGVPLLPGEPGFEERDGFVTARYTGTGFMLIKRQVLERMMTGYPETQYCTMQTYPAPATGPGAGAPYHNLFDCMVHPETRMYLSEDYTFCHRFRALGGQIWLDMRSKLRHVGAMEFEGTPSVQIL
jgi:hypothetical protein